MNKEQFKNAIRRGANPAGSYDLDEGVDKAEALAELALENRPAFKQQQAAKRAAQVASENERNR